MATPTNGSVSVPASTAVVYGGRSAPGGGPAERDLVANGGWTWFNDERAIVGGGYTFVSYNGGGGGSAHMLAARVDSSGAVTTGTITTSGSFDDHMSPGLVRLPSGVLFAAYCTNPDTFVRFRYSSAADSVTSWGSVNTTPATPYPCVYVNPRRLPASGQLLLFTRCVIDSGTRRHYYAASANDGASWGPWVEWCRPAVSGIPYMVMEQSGDRLYILMSDTHPVSGQSSIYAGYAEWVSGALKVYTMDGVELTLPCNPNQMTLVYDGSSARAWVWDIKIGSDGHPRVLFTRYPLNNGTDIRMMFSRWTGSAWSAPVDIAGATVGTSLYATEAYYTGGACFDGNDTNVVYLAREVATGVYEMQKWRSNDNGVTWTKVRDLSTGTASGQDNWRPVSPVGHTYDLAVIWPQGTYTAYDNWSAKLRAANAAG
jgi:hypothetical protein